jgi:DNA-directed RNA polymerase specialized sigma24 family protein
MSAASLTEVHQQFEAALPSFLRAARFTFRRRRPHDRDDAIAETLACAWKAWCGLVERSRDPRAVGVCGIANYAVRHTLNGRRIGNRSGGQGSADIYHRKARRDRGLKVVSYDSSRDDVPESWVGAWREWLAADHRVGPAAEAAFRVDFAAWLATLTPQARGIAELLASGATTGETARRFGVSDGRVSQMRRTLAAAWQGFQAQAAAL